MALQQCFAISLCSGKRASASCNAYLVTCCPLHGLGVGERCRYCSKRCCTSATASLSTLFRCTLSEVACNLCVAYGILYPSVCLMLSLYKSVDHQVAWWKPSWLGVLLTTHCTLYHSLAARRYSIPSPLFGAVHAMFLMQQSEKGQLSPETLTTFRQ